MKILWFDTETTGINPVSHDIIQIAGLIEIDGKIVEEFDMKCRPFDMSNIDPKALEVTGTSIEELKTRKKPEQMYLKLWKIFSTYIDKFNRSDKFIPAGQNCRFDIDFLSNFFLKNGDKYFGSWSTWNPLDLMQITMLLVYQEKIKLPNYKLATVCEALGVKLENAHDALVDIRATRQAVQKGLKLLTGR